MQNTDDFYKDLIDENDNVIKSENICGQKNLRLKSIIRFIASISALLAACIFATAVIVQYQSKRIEERALFIDNKHVGIETNKDGNKVVAVSGKIVNKTDDIYGLPHIDITVYNSDSKIISKQSFIPPATLLEPDTSVGFKYNLSVNISDIKGVSIELRK